MPHFPREVKVADYNRIPTGRSTGVFKLEQAVEIKMCVGVRFYDLNLGTLSSRATSMGLLPILLPEKGGTQWVSWLRQCATS
jgi:hypothetical protein